MTGKEEKMFCCLLSLTKGTLPEPLLLILLHSPQLQSGWCATGCHREMLAARNSRCDAHMNAPRAMLAVVQWHTGRGCTPLVAVAASASALATRTASVSYLAHRGAVSSPVQCRNDATAAAAAAALNARNRVLLSSLSHSVVLAMS